MSFLDDIIDFGSSALNYLTGNSVGGALARTAITGYVLSQTTESQNKQTELPPQAQTETAIAKTIDYGVREQVDPNTDTAIPVIYGTAFIGGSVTDAYMTSDNMTMWYCLTICEMTGNMINGTPSQISFQEIYWNGTKVNFQSDAVTVASFVNDDGVVDENPNGLIQIYCFSGNSTLPVGVGYGSPMPTFAYNLFPEWTNNHMMNDLVFALVKVTYNKEKNIQGLGNIEFKIRNTMTKPGDVINDYLTNTRYGCGIAAEEIYSV